MIYSNNNRISFSRTEVCLLELAEDVGVFCRNAGRLQDGHPEGENVPDLQMLQSSLGCTVQSSFQRILRLVYTACEGNKLAVVQVELISCVLTRNMTNVWMRFGSDLRL